MKNRVGLAIGAASVCALIVVASSVISRAEKDRQTSPQDLSKQTKELDSKIREAGESLSRQRDIGQGLDKLIADLEQIRLAIPAAQSREELKKLIAGRLDAAEAKKLLGQVPADPDLRKAAGKAEASIAALGSAAAPTGSPAVSSRAIALPAFATAQKPPKGVVEASPEEIQKLIAEGKAVKAAELVAPVQADEQFAFAEEARRAAELCESANNDLRSLRLGVMALERTSGASLTALQKEESVLRSAIAESGKQEGDHEKK